MPGHLDQINDKLPEESRINHLVAPLDLAPFKALRWQRRSLLDTPSSQQLVRRSMAGRRGRRCTHGAG